MPAPRVDASPCQSSSASAPRRFERAEHIELAVGAREDHHTDSRPSWRGQLSDRHLVGLDHRVGEDDLAHAAHLLLGGGRVGGLHHEADRLADLHLAHVRPAERGQRPLDRGALRVGDAGQMRDLDAGFEAPHCRAMLRAAERRQLPWGARRRLGGEEQRFTNRRRCTSRRTTNR